MSRILLIIAGLLWIALIVSYMISHKKR